MKCTICGKDAVWVENKAVYGRNYGKSYMIWLCPNRHYVGCHENTKRPKGTFADQETRAARVATHSVVDELWKSGRYSRGQVYKRLSDAFGYPVHIGSATPAVCEEIIKTTRELFEV